MWNKLSQVAGLTSVEDEDEKEEETTTVMEEDKEHLKQQELLIQHLKDLVRENEKRYQDKTKEYDELSSKFQKFKLQSKAKISHLTSQIKDQEKNVKKEDCDFDDTSSSDSSDQAHRGKVLLFKKQLEQVKQQLEKKEKECKSLVDGYERRINDLELQLNEKNILITTFAESKERTAEMPVDKSPKKDANVQEMYAQIVYKDSKIMELNNQILENEKQIMDLQEHIKEKDEVLQQRNRAVQLMAEDMSRKGKTVVNELDDTREQMKIMQENFSLNENDWKVQIEKYKLRITELENDISEWDKKLKSSEAFIKNLETVRYELTTKNADLQKKIVCVQESAAKQCELYNKEIEGEVETWKKSLDSEKQRVAELQKTLDELNSQSDNKVLKARVKERTRFKALERELNELKKANLEKPNEMVELEQHVAELEEEKGSLQLKLIDIEDQVSQLDKLKEENKKLHINVEDGLNKIQNYDKQILELQKDREEWEAKFETLNESYNELNDKVNMTSREKSDLEEKISALITTKEKVEFNYNELKREHSNIEVMFKEISENYQQMKDQKVTFELKNIELEEIKENDEKAKRELISRIEQLQESFSDESKPDIQLEKENLELKDKLRSMSDNCKELEIKNSNLLSQIESLQTTLADEQKEHSSYIKELTAKISDIEFKYEEALKAMNDKTLECVEMEKAVIQLENNLDNSQKRLADKYNEHAMEINKLINDNEIKQEEFKQTLNNKTLECVENEKIAKGLENNLKQAQNELDNVLSYFGVKTANDCKNYALQKAEEFANLQREYQKEISEKSIELENCTSKVEKLEFLLEKRDNDLKDFEVSLETLHKAVAEKETCIHNLSSEKEEKTTALKLLDETFQEKSEALIKSEELSRVLQEELNSLKASHSSHKDKVMANNLSLLGQISDLETEIASLRDELIIKDKNIDDLGNNILALEDSKQDIVAQMKGKESEVQLLKGELSTKETTVEDLNKRLHTLQNINENASSEIVEREKIILEKDKIIDGLNLSMESNKDLILSLQNENEILNKNVIDKISEISSLNQKIEELDQFAKTKKDELLEESKNHKEALYSLVKMEEELKVLKNKNILLEEEKLHSNLSLTEKDEVHKQILTEKIALESDILNLQEQHKSLISLLNEKSDSLDLLNNTIDKLHTSVEKHDENEKDFIKKLSNKSNNLKSFAEKWFSLLADNQKLFSDATETNNKLTELQTTIEELQEKLNEANSALEEKNIECSEQLSKTEKLKNDLQITYEMKCDLDNKLSKLQIQLQNVIDENNLDKAKIVALENQSSALSKDLSSYQKELEIALGDVENLKTENLKLTTSLNDNETILNNCELKEKHHEEEIHHLNESCGSFKSKVLELEDLNADLKHKIQSLENEFTQATSKYTEEKSALELLHQSLAKDNKNMQEANVELQAKVDHYANEKHLNECSASELKSLVSEKDSQITSLNAQLNVLFEKISSMQVDFNQNVDEHENYKKSVDAKLSCLQSYKQDYYTILKTFTDSQQISTDISFLETDNFVESADKLAEQSKNVLDNVVKHISEVQLLHSQFKSMEVNLNDLHVQNELLSTECSALKSSLTTLNEMLQNNLLQNDIMFETIVSKFSEKQENLTGLEIKIKSLYDLFDSQKNNIASLEYNLHLKSIELEKLKKTIKTLNEDNEEKGKSANLLVEEYKEKISKMDSSFQKVACDYDSLRESFEMKQRELENSLQSNQELTSSLLSKNEQISSILEEQENTNSYVAILQTDLQNARCSISELQNEIQQLNKQISEHALEPHVLEASNNVSNGLQEEVERLMKELESCEEEKLSLRQHTDNTNVELESLLNEKSVLEANLQQMEHKLNDAIETNLNLSGSLNESKSLLMHHQRIIEDLERQHLAYASKSKDMCEEIERLNSDKSQCDSKMNVIETNFQAFKNIVENVSKLLYSGDFEKELDLSLLTVHLEEEPLMELISELKANIHNFHKLQVKEKKDTQNIIKVLESKNFDLSKALEDAERLIKDQSLATDKKVHIKDLNIVPALEINAMQQSSSAVSSAEFLALENDNKTLKQEINEYKIKFGKSLNKLKLFKDKCDKLGEEIKELKERNSELEAINALSMQKDEDVQIRIASLSKDNEALLLQLNLCNEKYKHELDQSNYIISQLRERINLSDEECYRIQQELQEYKQTCEQSNISYELQKEDNERLRVKLNEIKELNETNKVNLAEMNLQLTQLKNENMHLKQEVENLKEHSNMLLSDNDTYQVLVENLTDTKSALEQKITTLKNKFEVEKQNLQAKFEDEFKNYSHDYLEKSSDDPKRVETLQEECIFLQNQCTEMQQFSKVLEEERNTLRRNQNLLEKEKVYLQQQLIEKTNELQTCKVKLNDCVKQETQAESDWNEQEIPAVDSTDNKFEYIQEENQKIKIQLDSLIQELNLTRVNFQSLQQDCLLKENSYKNEICQLKDQIQGRTELTVYTPPYNANLESELQQAMTSLHNQGLRCEELSLEVSKLVQERNILSWKLQQSSQQSTISGDSEASSSELTSIKVDSPNNAEIAALHSRLTESEKTCQQLRQANDALDRALVNERDQRRIIQEELGYAQEHFSEEAKASDEYHILLGDVNEPEYFPETNFAISRHVRSHAFKLRRWLRGRRVY